MCVIITVRVPICSIQPPDALASPEDKTEQDIDQMIYITAPDMQKFVIVTDRLIFLVKL